MYAGLAAEERAREAEDDEIAGTLNRYVQKVRNTTVDSSYLSYSLFFFSTLLLQLQASLALLHSDDTAFD